MGVRDVLCCVDGEAFARWVWGTAQGWHADAAASKQTNKPEQSGGGVTGGDHSLNLVHPIGRVVVRHRERRE
jgi:hypothetical protein